jgi:hypothetical protein
MKRKKIALSAGASFVLSAAVSASAAAPPTTTGPNNPNPPGTYPASVTAANVDVALLPGSVMGGGGSDDLKVSFPSAGPIKWTSSRFNEGDLALSIGPFDPNDPSYYPPNAHGVFRPGTDPANGFPFNNTTLAWRLNKETGATLASVRTNGYTPDITFGGSAVGTLHGAAYAAAQGSQGWGYRLNDGVFENGGANSIDIVMGAAGYDELLGESGFDIATAYFPYEQGWMGAWVENGAGENGSATITAGHPDLIGSTVARWQENSPGAGLYHFGNGRVELPEIDSATDGMLFVAPATDTSNGTHLAAGAPRDGGWDVTIREDQGDGLGNFPIKDVGGSTYQFLYVPYTATDLIGGWISGDDGAVLQGAGTTKFDVTRTEAGEYAISVFGEGDEKLTGDDGMLILSVASHDSTVAEGNVAARTFLSYEYDNLDSGDFIVQSRLDVAIEGGTSIFGDLLQLTDTDFYFAWVDFQNPLSFDTPVGGHGDTNGDGKVDIVDLNNVRNNFGGTGLGDTDGDGLVTISDLNEVRNNFGAGPSPNAVPEPATWALALAGIVAAGVVRRRK